MYIAMFVVDLELTNYIIANEQGWSQKIKLKKIKISIVLLFELKI
jgi:hypothetical protein